MTYSPATLNRWSIHNAIAVASLGIKVTERKASGVRLVVSENQTLSVTAYPGKGITPATMSHQSTKSVTQFSQVSEVATTDTVSTLTTSSH